MRAPAQAGPARRLSRTSIHLSYRVINERHQLCPSPTGRMDTRQIDRCHVGPVEGCTPWQRVVTVADECALQRVRRSSIRANSGQFRELLKRGIDNSSQRRYCTYTIPMSYDGSAPGSGASNRTADGFQRTAGQQNECLGFGSATTDCLVGIFQRKRVRRQPLSREQEQSSAAVYRISMHSRTTHCVEMPRLVGIVFFCPPSPDTIIQMHCVGRTMYMDLPTGS